MLEKEPERRDRAIFALENRIAAIEMLRQEVGLMETTEVNDSYRYPRGMLNASRRESRDQDGDEINLRHRLWQTRLWVGMSKDQAFDFARTIMRHRAITL